MVGFSKIHNEGYFQFKDVQFTGMKNTNNSLFQVTQGEAIESFDLSSNGEALVFGDSSGYNHIWSFYQDFRMNNYSNKTQIPIIPNVKYQFDEDFDLNAPYELSNDILLSNWLPDTKVVVGQPHPEIHPQILKNLQNTSFGGILPNPGLKNVNDGYIGLMDQEIKDLVKKY
jgi:hypothetical protein